MFTHAVTFTWGSFSQLKCPQRKTKTNRRSRAKLTVHFCRRILQMTRLTRRRPAMKEEAAEMSTATLSPSPISSTRVRITNIDARNIEKVKAIVCFQRGEVKQWDRRRCSSTLWCSYRMLRLRLFLLFNLRCSTCGSFSKSSICQSASY